jgi:multiple sugar transport system ATP-binding protein
VRKPAVFLFDEPLSNLDAKMRVQMRVEISRLHQQLGSTMIYVTHDQIEAMTMGERIVVMKDGLVQQVDDPLTLYDKPANRFVAGFIGTPPMNFFEGTIRVGAGGLSFECPAGFTLPVPAAQRAALAAFAGQPVVLGLRPEDVGSTAAEHLAGAPRLKARVEVVELMGSESFVHLKIGDTTLTSRVDAHRRFKVGETAEPAVFIDKVHFFNPAGEKRIG